MKAIEIKIDADTIRKMEKTAHRKAIIEAGIYGRPTHKVHKNKKAYDRKNNKNFLD